MVERLASNQMARVRFPPAAPIIRQACNLRVVAGKALAQWGLAE